MVDGGLWPTSSHSIVDVGGVVYGFILRPSGVSVRSTSTQWLSFRHLNLVLFLWIFSAAMTFRSWIEWSNWQKCLDTGLSICRWFMSDLWPVNRTRSAFCVSPTYWTAHFALDNINYILGATIGTGFHFENLSGGRAADCQTRFYVGACLAAWLPTPAVLRVGSFTWPKLPALKRLSN